MLLPTSVRLVALTPYRDARGWFMELFRDEWKLPVMPVQLNAGFSEAGTLRGVHVHPLHNDYLIVLEGEGAVGLRDLREGSPTEGLVAVVPLSMEAPQALIIPRGVAHGFFFTKRSIHFYAVDRYFSEEDELGCVWNDPELMIPWPGIPLHVSRKDQAAQPLQGLLAQLKRWQPIPVSPVLPALQEPPVSQSP